MTHAAPIRSDDVELLHGPQARAVVFDGATRTSAATLAARARALVDRLPQGAALIPLCEDRGSFLTVLCAAALRGQVLLLPAAPVPDVLADLRRRHPDSQLLADAPGRHPQAWVLPPLDMPADGGGSLRLPAAQLAVVGFTSGSTGVPAANAKAWGSFAISTRQNLDALADLWAGHGRADIVATVPAQHMYGMEMSVLLPLLGPLAVHAGRPFFPADIALALSQAQAPRLLVTTPVHLRALLASEVALPPLAGIISATAPLPQALAQAAEARYHCELRELFGATETCIFARRRTAREQRWTPFPGVRLVAAQGEGTQVQVPQRDVPVLLADMLSCDAEGRFEVLGRQADLLEIAGKRASLADLTRILLAVPGVEDAAMLQLDPDEAGVRRIAALVVAPHVAEPAILAALRNAIDPVFLPRPLLRVDALPRNATGKLARADLLARIAGA